jgi:hypothetical protein
MKFAANKLKITIQLLRSLGNQMAQKLVLAHFVDRLMFLMSVLKNKNTRANLNSPMSHFHKLLSRELTLVKE